MQLSTLDFLNEIRNHIKFGNRLSGKPDKPLRFQQVVIVEADDHSSYKDRVGEVITAYVHGWLREDGTFKVSNIFDFKKIGKDRIEFYSKINPIHYEQV